MSLEVDIYGRNMEITERIEEYVDKKVSKLDRYLSNIDQARVDLAYAKSARSAADRHVAQITITGRGYILRAEERADDIFAAFDAALSKMQRRIERFKGKRQRGRGDGRSTAELADVTELATEEIEETEVTPVIARRKKFFITPMDEMEAIEQMNLLGHEEFFVFFNANTNAINVLYKRRDDTYGLIEPELS
ncbi:MAG TPA: ribosome-associated translation inhibitor RaiA [Chloroflexi bacterium]|nr:ribosome-associated translation inhibitor RaiA [Chloroflexota bacterium]